MLTRRAPIKGALLATPADVEKPFPGRLSDHATRCANTAGCRFRASRLPFPSLLAASRNDPLCAFARAQALAQDWGSELEDLGEVGHLNPAAGFGEWPQALALSRLDR